MRTNTTIRKKLLIRGRLVLFLTMLLVIASQIVTGVLLKKSNDFHNEYNEMNALQELKISIYQILFQANKTTLTHSKDNYEFFMMLAFDARQKLSACNQTVTDNHNKIILDGIALLFDYTEKTVGILYRSNPKGTANRRIIEKMEFKIKQGLSQVDVLLTETKLEVANYAKINQTAFRHSSLTILLLGVMIFLTFLVGGIQFINNLTQPIHRFVLAANKISKGVRNIKVNIQSTDEFNLLADAFNNMVDSLEKTMVSKSYLDNILKNMFNALIVTNNNLTIQDANEAAVQLLDYSNAQLIGQPLQKFFTSLILKNATPNTDDELLHWSDIINNTDHFVDRSNQPIPALISCTILHNNQGEKDGLVIVGHDLRAKFEAENKLKKIRAQRQIDINEAQEEERLRIATDLHDGLGQMLTAILYSVQDFNSVGVKNSHQKDLLIQKIDNQINLAIKETRNLSHNLIPIILKDFGLIAAIRNLIDQANEMNTVHFTFNAYDFDERIDGKLEKSLYRICQESMNNIIKHAHAKTANYQIFKQDGIIVLVIDDDGQGFDVNKYEEKGGEGIGLFSMKERVVSFGGTFSLDSQAGLGTEIIIEIPIK